MPKRMIDTDLWNDDDIIADFTAEDKYFWLYLLTSPHNNICGVSKYSPALMARDMGLHKDTIINLIYRFEKVYGRLCVDKDTNEVIILNWSKYNWTKSEDFLKTIEKQLKDVRSEKIKNILIAKINEKQGKTVLTPSQEGTITIPNTNTNTIIIPEGYIFSGKILESIVKWLQYKKERKQTYKDTGFKTLLNKITKWVNDYGEEAVIESINNSISNNWSGVFEPTAKTTKKPQIAEIPKYSNTNADDALARALERSYNDK